MRSDDVRRLKVVRIGGHVTAVCDVTGIRAAPTRGGRSEVHIVLEDQDAFPRGGCILDDSELREKYAFLSGSAPRRLVLNQDPVDELNSGIAFKADPPKLAKHFRS